MDTEVIESIIASGSFGHGVPQAFKGAAGAWKGTLYFDAYAKDIWAGRREVVH